MGITTPEIAELRARIAARNRWHPDQPDDDLRAELAERRLTEIIRRELEIAPPLSAATRRRIAAPLIRPGGA
jgi:hypothetical protein